MRTSASTISFSFPSPAAAVDRLPDESLMAKKGDSSSSSSSRIKNKSQQSPLCGEMMLSCCQQQGPFFDHLPGCIPHRKIIIMLHKGAREAAANEKLGASGSPFSENCAAAQTGFIALSRHN